MSDKKKVLIIGGGGGGLPDQTGHSGDFLTTDGSAASWATLAGGGDLLAANNLSDVDDTATAFDNIKQAATESATGVVELATSAETDAGKAVQASDTRLSDSRDPNAHAASHTDGTDDIQDATDAQKGLATAAQITKLDGIEAGADVTDTTNVAAAGAVMSGEALGTPSSGTLTNCTGLPAAGVTAPLKTRVAGFVADGGGSAVSTGKVKGYLVIPFGATISAWSISVDTGTCTVKVWKVAAGTAVPTVSNVINTSGVSIASGTSVRSTTLTDFTTTTVSANDIMAFDVTAVSGATEITFELELTVT